VKNDSSNSRVIDWPRLKGQTLQTISGTLFTVVRVTDKYVTVRPESGTHNYALLIVQELEPNVANFAATGQLPKPAELARLGVRSIMTSYAWGVLHAVLVQDMAQVVCLPIVDTDFAGVWRIIDLPALGPGYFEPEAGTPWLRIGEPNRGRLRGDYRIGLEEGALTGRLRTFGGERIWVFQYDGVEGGSDYGCGWARLLSPTALEGEFIDGVGRFVAECQALPERHWRQSKTQKK
jgi:hypothetical protein